MDYPLTLCIESVLPPKQAARIRLKAIEAKRAKDVPHIPLGDPLEGTVYDALRWEAGSRLRIAFLNGQPEVQQKVIFYARQWCQYANIFFDFGNDPYAEIRISFKEGGGSRSFIGMYATGVSINKPTMVLDLTPASREEVFSRVVLHEFGHLLGLAHEHQNPKGGIQWDEDAVVKDLYPKWSREKIRRNYFEPLSVDQIRSTNFDPRSIMVYQIRPTWTRNHFSTNWNYTLSETDKQFISELYPR